MKEKLILIDWKWILWIIWKLIGLWGNWWEDWLWLGELMISLGLYLELNAIRIDFAF